MQQRRQPEILHHVLAALTCLGLLLLLGAVGPAMAYAQESTPTDGPSGWVYLPFTSRNYDSSWQWEASSPPLSPVPPVATNTVPAVAMDHTGQVHMFWGINTSAPQGKHIYHSISTGSGWTTPGAILPTLGVSYSPFTPVVGQDGALHLFWLNKLTSSSPPRLLYSVYRDGKWSAEEVVYNYPAYGAYDVHSSAVAQLDGSGQVYAIVQYVQLNLYTHQAVRGGAGWQATLVPRTNAGDAYAWTFGDRDRGVRRFVSRHTSGELRGYYSYWLGGAFLVSDEQVPFASRDRSGQLDAASNLHVYWRAEVPIVGGQVMGLFHQCFDPAMTPVGGPELLSGQEATAAAILATADESGSWTLGWKTAATGEVSIGVWQGCQRQKIVSMPVDQLTPWPPLKTLYTREPNRWCGVWKDGIGDYRVRCAGIAV